MLTLASQSNSVQSAEDSLDQHRSDELSSDSLDLVDQSRQNNASNELTGSRRQRDYSDLCAVIGEAVQRCLRLPSQIKLINSFSRDTTHEESRRREEDHSRDGNQNKEPAVISALRSGKHDT